MQSNETDSASAADVPSKGDAEVDSPHAEARELNRHGLALLRWVGGLVRVHAIVIGFGGLGLVLRDDWSSPAGRSIRLAVGVVAASLAFVGTRTYLRRDGSAAKALATFCALPAVLAFVGMVVFRSSGTWQVTLRALTYVALASLASCSLVRRCWILPTGSQVLRNRMADLTSMSAGLYRAFVVILVDGPLVAIVVMSLLRSARPFEAWFVMWLGSLVLLNVLIALDRLRTARSPERKLRAAAERVADGAVASSKGTK